MLPLVGVLVDDDEDVVDVLVGVYVEEEADEYKEAGAALGYKFAADAVRPE
jgi:hypothetical protein